MKNQRHNPQDGGSSVVDGTKAGEVLRHRYPIFALLGGILPLLWDRSKAFAMASLSTLVVFLTPLAAHARGGIDVIAIPLRSRSEFTEPSLALERTLP